MKIPKRVMVIAPHPDDEVLGVGGTMAALSAKGVEVIVVISTKGRADLFPAELIAEGRKEAVAAHELLGVRETIFIDDLPAAELDTIPHREVNLRIGELISEWEPDWVFVPFIGDIHLDHQLFFLSTLVASRPNQPKYPSKILAYETLSETNWNAPYITPGFTPQVFFDISDFLDVKLEAMATYESQVREAPSERSLEALQALATLRGATVYKQAAEAFVLVREVLAG